MYSKGESSEQKARWKLELIISGDPEQIGSETKNVFQGNEKELSQKINAYSVTADHHRIDGNWTLL